MTEFSFPEGGGHPSGEKLRDLSEVRVDLEGVRRLSRHFLGCIPVAKLTELAAEVHLGGAVEVEMTAFVKEDGMAFMKEDTALIRELGHHQREVEASRLLGAVNRKAATTLQLQGEIRCALQHVCARCLENFSVSMDIGVQRLFVAGPDPADAHHQQEMLDELTYLPDNHFALAPVVEEELLLALPMIPLCQPDCAGLCSGCGLNLNREACLCVEKAPEGPFAVLKQLKMT